MLLAGAAAANAETVLKNAFGVKGRQFLECARLFDAYKAWHDAGHMDTPDEAARKESALKMAIAGVRAGQRRAAQCARATAHARAVPERSRSPVC